MSKIKTRETVKDIKVLDKAAVAGERMKDAFIRTKDTVQNLSDDGQVSPTEYAEDKIQYAAQDVAEDTGRAVSSGTKKAVNKGKEDEPYLVTTKQIVQRASMVLTNVHYVIEAEFEMLPEKAAPGDNPGKFQDIVTRRMRKGQCFSTPYFGCREFPAHFKQWEGGPIPTIDETRDLGFMLYDFDYSDPQNITPLYFRAKMEHGVIQVAGCEVFK